MIAIIAILTVAFLPGALRAPARARDAGRIKAVADIQAAIEGYIAGHNGTFPTLGTNDAASTGVIANPPVASSLLTTLGMNAVYSTGSNSTYYYYYSPAVVGSPAVPAFYAVGFVPETIATVNSTANIGGFGGGNNPRTWFTTAPSAAAPASATSMYVVTGPI